MAVQIRPTSIPAVLIITPTKFEDQRGFFSEIFRHDTFSSRDIAVNFVQDNQSLSKKTGTIRGLHFQTPPFAQAKLVRVARGRIFDVAVDIRRTSPTFGRHVAFELTADSLEQVFIPAGFAHGFCTLEPNTEVVYKVDNYYSPESDRGLLWSDPDLGIEWPIDPEIAELSDRDKRHSLLRDLPTYF